MKLLPNLLTLLQCCVIISQIYIRRFFYENETNLGRLLLLSLLFLLLSGCNEKPREENIALVASLTNMDGTGEIRIGMSYVALSATFKKLGIPCRNVEGSLVQANVIRDNYDNHAGTYHFSKFLESLEPELSLSPDFGLAVISPTQSKEGLTEGDSVEKLKQLYPDYEYLHNPYKETGNTPYYLSGAGVVEGWFIKEFWRPNDNLIVSAISVTGPKPSDTVSGIEIKFLPAAVAREQNWW